MLEFEEQLQQIQLLVNLKKVADPLLTYAQTALNNAQKALDEAEPADEDYIELRDALAGPRPPTTTSAAGSGLQAQLDEGKSRCTPETHLLPNLDNDRLVVGGQGRPAAAEAAVAGRPAAQLTTSTATAYSQFEGGPEAVGRRVAGVSGRGAAAGELRAQYGAQRPMPSKSWTRASGGSPTLSR